MILRALCFSRLAALLLVALGFGAAPAAAQGCCYAPAPVYYQSCSCCGCGSAYYGSYYGAYAYPGYGYGGYGGCDGCGYGYGYGAGYAAYEMPAPVVAPRVYRPRPVYTRYWGPRRPVTARYWTGK